MTKLLALTLLLCSLTTHATTSVVFPTYTKHVTYTETPDYIENFDNLSIGIESTGETDKGLVYVHVNSENKSSLYAYIFTYNKSEGVQLGGGTFLAMGGYETTIKFAPAFAIRYKWLRLTTSYPLGKLVDAKADLLNIQIIIPLGD